MNTNDTKLLNLHICASNGAADLADIAKVVTPEPTKTWWPIPHNRLIDEFQRQAAEGGLEIVQSQHTLARGGLRYFGLFQVKGINRRHGDDVGTVIGLRNSHDKAFAASICAGDAPFVCTNLIFSNEITLGRKHTTFILRDLAETIAKAIGRLGSHWSSQDDRVDAYRERSLTNAEAHDLIIRSYRAGAIGSTHISKVAEQWHTPEHDDFSLRNGWSLYNAFTNVYRGNLASLNKRSDALHGVLDLAFGLN